MQKLFPAKLKPGDEVRIIAPARSLAIITPESRAIADQRLSDLGLNVSFGKHVDESDTFLSCSIASRVEDLHAAFKDQNIKAIFTVIGGFNSNQLLKYIDWDLIKNNPKIFCGFSDITALNNAIFAKTGLVTYSGPHYSSFGQKLYFDYTLDYCKKCLFSDDSYTLTPADYWSDDAWYKDQDNRIQIPNPGWQVIHQGEAEGTIVGANLCTLNLLQGTEYFPSLANSILFIEDDGSSSPVDIDRNLQSLIHLPDFLGVKGVVIGRFQKETDMTPEKLEFIISTKKELDSIPVVAGVDFGHTSPMITFPIGGTAKMSLLHSPTLEVENK